MAHHHASPCSHDKSQFIEWFPGRDRACVALIVVLCGPSPVWTTSCVEQFLRGIHHQRLVMCSHQSSPRPWPVSTPRTVLIKWEHPRCYCDPSPSSRSVCDVGKLHGTMALSERTFHKVPISASRDLGNVFELCPCKGFRMVAN